MRATMGFVVTAKMIEERVGMRYSGRTKAFALALSMLMSMQLGMPAPVAVAMEADDAQTMELQTEDAGLPADGTP